MVASLVYWFLEGPAPAWHQASDDTREVDTLIGTSLPIRGVHIRV
ncbi:hypothetical protein [Endozoicomonas elysicola]|nr:hypothetical protein [Endozoicomonas elysicola]